MKITLKQARKMKDLSQRFIADKMGINIDTYRRIEEDTDKATVAQVKSITEIIGVHYDDIFFNDYTTNSGIAGQRGGQTHAQQ